MGFLETSWQILVIVLLVLANAFFVAAEFAIVKVRVSQLRPLLAARDWRVQRSLHVIKHLDAYLSASQLGITLASLGLGWVGEPFIAGWLQAPLVRLGVSSEWAVHSLAYAIALGIITSVHIVVGEQAPKFLAIQRPRAVTLWVSPVLVGFRYMFWPLIWLLNLSANAMLRVIGLPAGAESEQILTADELQHMLVHSAHVHPTDELVHRLMLKALRSRETTAEEIMIPRDRVSVLWASQSLEENLATARRAGYSRLPVCGDTANDVVGVIHVKELLWQYQMLGPQMKLTDIVRPVLTFTPQTRLPAVLQLFQKSHSHLAVVVDDASRMLGIVSFEDVLEELVGDIRDEFDIEKGPIYDRTGNAILVDADLPLRDVAIEMGWPLPTHTTQTVEKWCLARWGRTPRPGERLDVDDLTLVAEEVTPRGLRRVRLIRQPTPSGGYEL